VAVPVRVDVWDGLPVRLRPGDDRGAGTGDPEVKEVIANPPEWLQERSRQVGAELGDGLREGPSWVAFARENGTVYHTYTVMAPDPFVAPYYSFLLERTPKGRDEAEPRTWRKDEYPD
jgi:predicted dithiol-disulfide oxidoreductase (DUF899 family)